jgi:hypothetical protein
MNVDPDPHARVSGRVLLYTSASKDATPAMTMKQEVTSQLPPILEKLAGRYSPVWM